MSDLTPETLAEWREAMRRVESLGNIDSEDARRFYVLLDAFAAERERADRNLEATRKLFVQGRDQRIRAEKAEAELAAEWGRREQAEQMEAAMNEVNSRLGHRLGEAEARAEQAEAERDALRAAVAAIADEWASSRGPLGWTVNDAVQHQCADELRALLPDPDAALQPVKAQAVRTALVPRHGECDCEYCLWLVERADRIEGGADDE